MPVYLKKQLQIMQHYINIILCRLVTYMNHEFDVNIYNL